MRGGFTGLRLLLMVLLVVVGCARPQSSLAQDQKSDMKESAKRLVKVMAKADVKSLAVADFVTTEGAVSVEGHYLAQELAEEIGRSKHLAVTGPTEVRVLLHGAAMTATDMGGTAVVEKIRNDLHADAVVTGSIEVARERFSVKMAVRNLKDLSVIVQDEEAVKRPSYADALAFLDPTGVVAKVARPGEDGIGVPQCIKCVAPNYADQNGKPKENGKVVLEIVVDEQGLVPRVALLRSTDTALNERAVEVVKKWTFKPVKDKKTGKPVAVIVPVEVTFQRY